MSWPLLALDLVGVFAFGLSGGFAAVRKDFDVLGVVVLAIAAGLGGGILRDVLIGAVPPVGLSDWRLLSAACAAGLITFLWHPRLSRIGRLVLVVDAGGLAVFTIAGTLKALDLGTSSLTAVIVGVVTGVGGGVIRDLLAGEVPRVLAASELYAIPALVGATLFATAWSVGFVNPVVTWGSVLLIVGFRMLAVVHDWQAPTPPRPLR